MTKSLHWIFYVSFAAVIVVIAAVHFILKSGYDIKLPLTLFMDGTKEMSGESSIVSVSGSDVMFCTKHHRYRAVNNHTRITGRMTVRTGSDSSMTFSLTSLGCCHIYPNSVVYIAEVGRFTDGRAEPGYGRFSEFIVESGKFFCEVNTYSDNSLVRVRTSSADLMVNKGSLFVECENDFASKVICIAGEVLYRPAVQRYDFRQRYSKDADMPVQRFLSRHNRLSGGEFVILTHEMSEDLDRLIDKVCKSSFFPNVDKPDMIDTIKIEPSRLEQSELPEPPFHFNKNE